VRPESRTFVATTDQAGLTVLAALRGWLPGTSWSAVRKLLADRRIAVNGSLCLDEARRIKTGETVTLCGSQLPAPAGEGDVRVVWLDQDVIVVDKPAGMITLRHPAERNWTERKKRRQPAVDDLVPDLIAHHKDFLAPGGNRATGIFSVHRIDRDTSGLVVFARNAKSRDSLIGQFKKHAIERTYLAIACGELVAKTIRSHLVDDRGDGKRGSTKAPGVGKLAVTHLRPLETWSGFTLVECRLETGRTHQIRIHLSEAGHPIFGDTKYGSLGTSSDEESRFPPNLAALPRLALHASILGFRQSTSGASLRFESPLPPDFLLLIERLRRPING
jgi:23S rRNA pseudouridine1911/1915/1917 synthase